MADRYTIIDMPAAIAARERPTVTLWNRLEGRPRAVNFERAVRFEIRDALWMLTRQWQSGEFQGEDSGSPVSAQMQVASTRLTRFQPGDGPYEDFENELPLETRVEHQPVAFDFSGNKVALDLRIILGRRWLKLISNIADYADAFIRKYKIDLPDPTRREDAAICAHSDVWQNFAAVAERTMDGAALYQYLVADSTRHPYDGIAALDAHKPALDLAGQQFIGWVQRLLTQPVTPQNPSWQPARFEHRFSCAAPTSEGEVVYKAGEYHHGTLDWHSFDIDPNAQPGTSLAASADPRTVLNRELVPVPLTYAGMPNPRWWTIEDSQTNFGEIRPDTTDLAKLLFIEFGLVYSNDWFIVPFTLAAGSIARVRRLVVTNVFGEKFLIEAAGRGLDDAWQRWSVFTVNIKGRDLAAADPGLLLLPAVPKVQESAPTEEVLLMRDEIANMVWGIEKTIQAPDGRGKSGGNAGRETRAYFERLLRAAGVASNPPALENDASIRYQAMTSVPENWIPFIPVRARGTEREIELQRASMPRILEGDVLPVVKVRPRTTLLRTGLDEPTPQPYLIPEEEIPREGLLITRSFQRTRWADGKVFVWLGVRKRVGRGEGSSGLAFDQIVPK